MPNPISFITANYVARQLDYPGGRTDDWERHDQATVDNASAQSFGQIARDIANAGFENIDIWMAHCHFARHSKEDYIEVVKGICSQYDFAISSYAGGLNPDQFPDLAAPFKFMKQLGAPILAGGMWGADPASLTPQISDICQKLGVKWAYENHPEKTPGEILSKIAGGQYPNVGIALDTGWCGTHQMDAVEAAKRLRDHLYIVHLKDVTRPGDHETCTLGDGIVGVEKVVRYLTDSSWPGTFCIEHEPFDRDPMPEIMISLQRLQEWLR